MQYHRTPSVRSVRRIRMMQPAPSGRAVGASVPLRGQLAEHFDRRLLDRALTPLLHHPFLLLVLGVGLGTALVVWSLLPWALPAKASEPAMSGQATTSPPPPSDISERDEVLAVLAGYNQASVVAGASGSVEPLMPFLAADGPALRAARAEFARRTIGDERSEASLVRWGVLQITIDGVQALVETQEQWDVITSARGDVLRSRRGVLSRNLYALRRSSAGWRIVSVTTTPIVT
jgi:hypothetical protein